MLMPIALLSLALALAMYQPRAAWSYWFLLATLVFLMGGNLENPDREPYLDNYTSLLARRGEGTFEFGYQFLASACARLGLPFQAFSFVVIALGLVLIGSTLRRFSDRPALLLCMYSAYPMFWDYVQVRNFLAMAVLTFAARYLIGRRKRLLPYLLGVAIASSMHVASLVFVLMPLATIRRPRVFYFVAFVALGAYMIALSSLIANPFFDFLVHKVDTYAFTETSSTTKLAVIAFYLTTLLLLGVCGKEMRKRLKHAVAPGVRVPKASGTRESTVEPVDADTVFRMHVLAACFLPLATINLDFMRLYRNMFMLACLVFAATLPQVRGQLRRPLLRGAVALYLGACLVGLTHFISQSDVIGPLFRNHLLSAG